MFLHRRRVVGISVCLLAILAAWIACTGITKFIGGNSMAQASSVPNNDAVRWDGTRFGLLPTVSEEAETLIREGQAAVPTLLDAIADPGLFVTAHVLLTKIAGIQYETFPSWNGLEVDLDAEGEVSIDPDQRVDLARRWQRYFQTEPRPGTLPSGN